VVGNADEVNGQRPNLVEAQASPRRQVGPVRNKPVQLPDGSLLCGASTEDRGWQIHMEHTADLGGSWTAHRR